MRAPGGRSASVSTALAVLLLTLGPLSVLGDVPAVHAQGATTISITTSNGATVCPGSLKGAWDPGTETCSITAVGSVSLSEDDWAMLAEFLHLIFDLSIDPNYALYIPQGTTLDVGAGVFISAMGVASDSTQEVYAVINSGTINNNGSMIGLSSGNGALLNSGTINNGELGYLQFGATNTNIGIFNSGTINNGGFLRGYSDLYGIVNSGTINNEEFGSVEGDGGSVFLGYTATSGQGIYNDGGTINNLGFSVKGESSWGEIGDMTGYLTPPYGVYNAGGAINDYCGNLNSSPNLSYSSYGGAPPDSISCTSIVFHVKGVLGALFDDNEGVYITMSWGPFVLPWTDSLWQQEGYVGTGSAVFSEPVPATEPFTYSFPAHLICSSELWPGLPNPPCYPSQPIYTCQTGCSGTVTASGEGGLGAFVVTYGPPLATTISASPAAPIDGGQSATLSTVSSFGGGTPPFTCRWLEKSGTAGFSGFGASFPCSAGDAPSESTGALAAGSYLFELQVTDSSSPALVVASNAVGVTVDAALAAPSVSASAGEIDRGQSANLTSTAVSTGTPPYSSQWYGEAPGGGAFAPIPGATSSTYDFSTKSSTAPGAWSFELRVTDSSATPVTVTSGAVTVWVSVPFPPVVAGGGVPMPAGATFQYDGHALVAPSGDEGYGGAWGSYFFAGPQSDVPQPMMEGWGGCYGTYGGVAGWIVTEIA